MKIDVTLEITPEMMKTAKDNGGNAPIGHMGTHFDVMDKEFPLDYTERVAVVFDVSHVEGREIGMEDIDLDRVREGMFVGFYTGFLEREGYGTPTYFQGHPELSRDLIEALLCRGVSVIGVDFAGIRRAGEHIPMDRHCAERGAFVVENLANLRAAVGEGAVAHIYPMRYKGMTGLPCRVILEK